MNKYPHAEIVRSMLMNRKRVLGTLLITSMMIQSTSTGNVNAQSYVEQTNIKNAIHRTWNQTNNTDKKTGKVDLEIELLLPVKNGSSSIITGTLKNDKSSYDLNFQYDSESQKIYGTASYCEPGRYLLTLQGNGFHTFTQEVEVVASMTSKLYLKNSHELDAMYQHSARPGVIGYGDVTEDGKVDQEDMNAMMTAIEQGSENSIYDLNQDGSVDILDASYITYNMNQNNIESSVLQVLSIECVEEVKSVGKMVGNIEDLLSDIGFVQLKPETDEEISEENPVAIEIEIAADVSTTEGITIAAPKNPDHAITQGTILVEDQDGNWYEAQIQSKEGAKIRTATEETSVTKLVAVLEADGSIVLNLNGQIAIKKVSIQVTGTKSRQLAEIAQVQFLNDMEQRIAPPELSVPQNVVTTPGNKEFTVRWDKVANVTGYQVEICSKDKKEILTTGSNQIVIKQLLQEQLKNGSTYEVRVLAINGNWKSDYSNTVSVTPKTTKAPDAPENIIIKGGYQLLNIEWKAMEDTDRYHLYYREKGTEAYTKIADITSNKYQLTGLKVNTSYEIYLEGVNEYGAGQKSKDSIGTTTELEYAKTTNYKLINVPSDGEVTAHIKSVEYPSGTADHPYAIVDHDYGTDWILQSWTSGGYAGGQQGPIVTFDDFYQMDHIIMVESSKQTYDYFYSKLRYWDASGKEHVITVKPDVKYDSNGKRYYEYNLAKPITTNKVQISLSNYLAYSDGMISISELKFYYYDTLEEDIYQLFEDDTHVRLKPGISIEDINQLAARLDEVDPVSGEYHYKKSILEIELQNAREILAEVSLRESIPLDTKRSKANDHNTGFYDGLNAWQPLGITAYQGESLVLYVGKANAKIGEYSNVRLIATQHHSESGKFSKEVVGNLKVGRNEVTIPWISSMAVEHGGSLYIEYTGTNPNDVIEVRVSGGTEIPMLDVSNQTTETEKKVAIRKYLEQLTAHVDSLEDRHNEIHLGHDDTNCNYEYDEKNCILNLTEIVLDQMMYSVAAQQVLTGVIRKAGSEDMNTMVDAMYDTLVAMDQAMKISYQHKGLTEYPTDPKEYEAFVAQYGDKNKMPTSRLNLRYMRMFAGAFMYAGSLHMGIEWDSIPGLMTGAAIEADENGKYNSGEFFGWGIAHEIGHTINQKDYEIVEVTNNYFALLQTAKGTNDSVRLNYANVYEKVTSGTIGAASNGFVQLAMYWQLHLAYDNGFNYKTYDNYTDQFNNLIYARMDAYARNHNIAPKFADGRSFTLSDCKDKDNKFMRLACAATQKDSLDFFRSWGMMPDETTTQYAAQFEKESRKIQYITDDAKAYRINNELQAESIAEKTARATVQASLTRENNSKQVTISLGVTGMEAGSLLGYEILRNGAVVGFVDGSQAEYVDTVPFNNQVATYSVVAYDKFLNETEVSELDAIKITHDGSLSKESWSISTNMTSEQDEQDENDVCGVHPIQAVSKLIDDNYTDTYTGKVTSGMPEIVFSLGEVTQLMGMKMTFDTSKPVSEYELLGSLDGSNWTTIKSGAFDTKVEQETIYFTKENVVGAHIDLWSVSYVKLVIKGQNTVALKEIDLIGQPDDNVELIEVGIGKLASDYIVDPSTLETIPQGSVIFTGEYSGHPAYNVVLLIDADTDQVVTGSQYIFAQNPDESDLGAVSNGTWLYVIEPNEDGSIPVLPKRVKAELYRVDDATTLEGQRLVSNTLVIDVPETLSDLTIHKNEPTRVK